MFAQGRIRADRGLSDDGAEAPPFGGTMPTVQPSAVSVLRSIRTLSVRRLRVVDPRFLGSPPTDLGMPRNREHAWVKAILGSSLRPRGAGRRADFAAYPVAMATDGLEAEYYFYKLLLSLLILFIITTSL